MRARALVFLLGLLACSGAQAQPAASPFTLLDVPYISQSEALCGGAAAAMILRYWGARGLTAESFAPLVDKSAAGISTATLVGDLRRRGWDATGVAGTDALLASELANGRPVMALIEDRPSTFHYVVIVAAHDRAVVFHDPARSPYRVASRAEFERRWAAAGRWMAVVVPAAGASVGPPAETPTAAPASSTPCERLIADGVARAQANELAEAERTLSAAVACGGNGALRELAGVRVLQQRWPEAEDLAAAALAADPRDAYAWRLLATSRFVQDDALAALDAWNEVGEPRLDLVSVDGLERTRQRVVERLLDFDLDAPLTRGAFTRGRRRLAELPSAAVTRLEYAPVPGGLVEVQAHVLERPRVPRGWPTYVAMAAAAVATRQVQLASASPTGGGERIAGTWRFWPNRPRVAIAVASPAPWGGVWDLQAAWEKQPFDRDDLTAAQRTSVRAGAANWIMSAVEVSARAGLDRWDDRDGYAAFGGALRLASTRDRAHAFVDADVWAGNGTFATATTSVRLQSSSERQGLMLVAEGGGSFASSRAPLDLWPGGDTGRARSTLLRAHPIVDDGALRTARLGRSLTHVTGESQYWWLAPAGLRVAAAAFADAAHTARRLEPGARGDVDAGLGVRLTAPVMPGVFRVDVAKGLRDGATTASFVYAP